MSSCRIMAASRISSWRDFLAWFDGDGLGIFLYYFLRLIPIRLMDQKAANRWVARFIPMVLIGIVGYATWVIVVLVCGSSGFSLRPLRRIWDILLNNLHSGLSYQTFRVPSYSTAWSCYRYSDFIFCLTALRLVFILPNIIYHCYQSWLHPARSAILQGESQLG